MAINDNKMGIRKKWTSVNLGPIIVNLVTKNEMKNKFDVQVETELFNSLASQHFYTSGTK